MKIPSLALRARTLGVATAAAVAMSVVSPTTPASAYVPNSMYVVAQSIGAPAMWNAGFTGKGVDIAVIDTGVTPVTGLSGTISDGTPKLYNGPDLSFDSQKASLRYKDGYGHGTHMAGIAAGKDPGWTPANAATTWAGIAPDSKILNMKVADQGGAVDITQVVAAIHWIVQHRKDNGLNIRVINLSYGTDYYATNDNLWHAVEVAFRAGIYVVASSGNSGAFPILANPANFSKLLSVGGVDTEGTAARTDDVEAPFSQYMTGTTQGQRPPRVYAPATSVSSLAVPGSMLDQAFPGARDGTRFFRGSGTSQAAAVISGATALVMQQRPTANMAQIMKLLISSCPSCTTADNWAPKAELIDLAKIKNLPTPAATDPTTWLTGGSGKIDVSRGTEKLAYNGVALAGEKDIFGKTWNSGAIARAGADQKAWTGGTFNGTVMAGTTWSGTTFATATWAGTNFAGTAWTSIPNSDNYWDGTGWKGTGWKGTGWKGTGWKGTVWCGAGWA